MPLYIIISKNLTHPLQSRKKHFLKMFEKSPLTKLMEYCKN